MFIVRTLNNGWIKVVQHSIFQNKTFLGWSWFPSSLMRLSHEFEIISTMHRGIRVLYFRTNSKLQYFVIYNDLLIYINIKSQSLVTNEWDSVASRVSAGNFIVSSNKNKDNIKIVSIYTALSLIEM